MINLKGRLFTLASMPTECVRHAISFSMNVIIAAVLSCLVSAVHAAEMTKYCRIWKWGTATWLLIAFVGFVGSCGSLAVASPTPPLLALQQPGWSSGVSGIICSCPLGDNFSLLPNRQFQITEIGWWTGQKHNSSFRLEVFKGAAHNAVGPKLFSELIDVNGPRFDDSSELFNGIQRDYNRAKLLGDLQLIGAQEYWLSIQAFGANGQETNFAWFNSSEGDHFSRSHAGLWNESIYDRSWSIYGFVVPEPTSLQWVIVIGLTRVRFRYK